VPGHSQTRGVEKMFRKIRLRCSPISCSVLAALGQSSASGTGMSRALGTDREERSGRRRRCGSLRSHTPTHVRDRAHTHTYNQEDALSVQHQHAFEELVQGLSVCPESNERHQNVALCPSSVWYTLQGNQESQKVPCALQSGKGGPQKTES
jgi:hypothetical protein